MSRGRLSAILFTVILTLPATLFAGGKESATFRATATGEISGGPQSHVNGITSATTQVVIRLMPIDLSLLGAVVGSGDICFWQSRYEGPLTIDRDKSGNAVASYWFTARAKDGVTDVKYLLKLRGAFDDRSNWLPAPGTTVNMLVGDWSVAVEAKGEGRNACSGTGTVAATTITVERLP